jgi:thioredoxin 2
MGFLMDSRAKTATHWQLIGDEVVHTCEECHAKNRIPAEHLGRSGKCGACGRRLDPLNVPLDVDPTAFSNITSKTALPVLIDFWAAWCGPCRMVAPEVQATAHESAGKAVVLKVDTERHPDLAARFQVSGIPNLVIMKNGKVVRQQAGAVNRHEMARWLAAA